MSGNSERDSNVEPVYKVGRRHQQQIIETQLAAPKTETRGAEVFARSNLAVSAADAIALEGRHSQRKAGSESLMPLAYQSRASVFEVDEEDPDFAAAEEGICGAVLNYVLGKQFVEDRGSLDENSVFLMPWQARVPLAIVACLRLTCCPQTLKKLVLLKVVFIWTGEQTVPWTNHDTMPNHFECRFMCFPLIVMKSPGITW